jgi:radical SAM-linked protein
MVGEKIRFRFEKAGDLRLVSHLDLMRCFERMLRRARVPFKSTQGFHPTPRLVFALSLPLGVVGRNEVVELELTEPCDADDLRGRLDAQAPAGVTFTAARVVEPRATAMPRRVVYRMPLPADRVADARAAAADLHAAEKVWADRLRPRPRRVNIKPYLRRLGVDDGRLVLDLWVTQSGTARADELLRLLGVSDVYDAGAVLERTELEVHDETPPGQPDGPPAGPPETAVLEHAAAAAADDEESATPATWGGSPHGPVVE